MLKNKISYYLLGIIGFVLAFFGGFLCYEGDLLIKNYEHQLVSYIEKGERSYDGEIKLFLGLALVVIGIVLMLINFGRYWNENIATPPREID